MSAIRIANRYAKSLLQLAEEKNSLEQVMGDMESIHTALAGSREFQLLLKSPIVQSDKKMQVIQAVFGGRIHVITQQFIEIMVRKGREGFLQEVIGSFRTMFNQRKGITPVILTTAYPISDDTRNNIIARLKEAHSLHTIELTEEVDESLIGGYVLQFAGKQIDTSIVRGLNILKDEFDNNDYIRKF